MEKCKVPLKKDFLFWGGLFLTMAVLVPNSVRASDYYVSPNGNDSNLGKETSPFRSIKKGIAALVAGDTLFIRGGTYSEILESHSGTNFPSGTSWANSVRVAAYPGEQVTLMGSIGIGKEQPLTQYLIFDGITIDAKDHKSGISIDGGAHHIRFINGEVKNSINYAGIYTSYRNDPNPGDDVFHEFINMKVHHNGIEGNFIGGFHIKTSGTSINNCQIHDNVGWGINVWAEEQEKTKENTFLNNQIWNNRSGGIRVNRSDTNLLYNNIVWNNQNGISVGRQGNLNGTKVYHNTIYVNGGYGVIVYAGATNTDIRNNIIFNNSTNIRQEGTGTILSNNLTKDPNFVNSAESDFHLSGSSPAIKSGKPLKEVSRDIDGLARDPSNPSIGAYEYKKSGDDSLSVPPISPKNLKIN